MKNYYEILEVDVKASSEIIDKAYKVLAKKYHPDTQSEDKKEWAEAKFKEINEAYEVISNEEKRKEYDIELDYDKNSVFEALCAKNEHLQHKVEELQNELDYIKSHSNNTTSFQNDIPNSSQVEANTYQSEPNINFNGNSYNSYQPQQETIYYETKVPYTKNKLKDFIAFLITALCIIGIRIFTLENTFYT